MKNNQELIVYLLEFGFDQNGISKILNNCVISNLTKERLFSNIKRNNKYLLKKGFTKKEIIKITKATPTLYGYSIKNMEQKISNLIELGYTEKEIIQMIKKHPSLYDYSIKNIKQKVKDLIKFGYTEKEIIKITKVFPALYSLSIENVKKKINALMNLGFTYEEIIKITKELPVIYGLNIENINEKIEYLREINLEEVIFIDTKQLMQNVELTYARYEFYKSIGIVITINNFRLLFIGEKIFNKRFNITKKELINIYSYEEKKKQNKIVSHTNSNKEIIKYLLEFGFKENEIIEILKVHSIKKMKSETLLINIKKVNDFLLKNHYNKQEIIKMVRNFPTLYSYGVNSLEEKNKDLIEIGYSENDIIKMKKISPQLYSYSTKNIKQKIEYLIKLGYSKQEILKLTKDLPEIYGYSIERIKQRIEDLINLGYNDKEKVLKMTKLHIKLYSYSIENIKQRIIDLMKLGFSHEEVIDMTKKFPNLFGLSLETIKEKIEYLREINLEEVIFIDTKQLMQSVELTYARYEFYKSINKEITMNNYRLLFLDEKAFNKRFCVTKKELITIHPYKQKIEKKKVKKYHE